MATPVDPGPAIQWARNPHWSALLVAEVHSLPHPDAHRLFVSASRRSEDWKTRRQATLDELAQALFLNGGDLLRQRKQGESIHRRLNTLGKEYASNILTLKHDPYAEATNLAFIRQDDPYFDELYDILRDHPEFPQWQEGQAVLPADDDPMQGIYYAHHAAPAPAPGPVAAAVAAPPPAHAQSPVSPRQAAPHQPIAGPAYPNPLLAHLYPQAPQPQPQPATAAGSSPRDAAAQAALKRAREDPRSPSPVRAAPAPPQTQAGPASPLRNLHVPDLPDVEEPAHALALVPGPVPAPAGVDDGDAGLSHCPKCDLTLYALGGPAAEEEHLRQCLDAGGATVHECPVCGARMDGWSEVLAARHVDACCEGATRGGTRAAREHVVFVCDDKTIPRDSKSGPLECIMCFDEFAPCERLARLSCCCVFHEGCITEYWQAPSKFCPTHRELDSTLEVDMRA